MPIFIPGAAALKFAMGYALAPYASGSQAITGVGFKPKIVMIKAVGTGGSWPMWSDGWSDAVVHYCQYSRGHIVDPAVNSTGSACVMIVLDAANFATAWITSMDADGFTLQWLNSPGLTVDFIWLAIG